LVATSLEHDEDEARLSPVPDSRPFVDVLVRRAEALLDRAKQRLEQKSATVSPADQRNYEDLLIGVAYFRTFEGRQVLTEAGDGIGRVTSYRSFVGHYRRWTEAPLELPSFLQNPAHMFAIFFQIRRSFALIRELIQGDSRPAVRLRASIWNSIFPHELRLYGNLLYDRMHDITTLILGPSGTGKELVATAIGASRFVPFQSQKMQFAEPFAGAFHPLNLSAMPRDLIESEMFGHCAGAFTGATRERVGWFERCARGHTVFLDEIGELDPAIQVKLLRALQSREFYRVGETEPRTFQGRIIAATNRDLNVEMATGRFRQDLFFRLCSDVIRTPSLREQLDDRPDELPLLVRLAASKCLGERAWPEQVDWLTELSLAWIRRAPSMGESYPWSGNFRELEQCVRSVMVRGEYHPTLVATPTTRADALPNAAAAQQPALLDEFLARVRRGELTYEELLQHYCSLIHSRSAHLTATARKLKKHRATVEERIVPELVALFQRDK
jgi:transcriptional regulator with AAA-type ATPase domain